MPRDLGSARGGAAAMARVGVRATNARAVPRSPRRRLPSGQTSSRGSRRRARRDHGSARSCLPCSRTGRPRGSLDARQLVAPGIFHEASRPAHRRPSLIPSRPGRSVPPKRTIIVRPRRRCRVRRSRRHARGEKARAAGASSCPSSRDGLIGLVSSGRARRHRPNGGSRRLGDRPMCDTCLFLVRFGT